MRHAAGPILLALMAPLLLGLRSSAAPQPEVGRLADALRSLYAEPREPWERWRRDRRRVALPDGGTIEREAAYRDRPLFPAAAESLLGSAAGDDAPFGAWLLGTLPPDRASEAEPILVEALGRANLRAAFEAARALAVVGGPSSVPHLERVAGGGGSPELVAAAAWARERIQQRQGTAAPYQPPPVPCPLGPGFQKGVCWWMSEGRRDAGAASFRALRSLGVDWISIHTWDPQQKAADDPEFVDPRPFEIRGLEAMVQNAHTVGLKVVVKPHLEMRGYIPTEEERRVLRGADPEARRKLFLRIEREAAQAPAAWHNLIEMRSDADWRRWFAHYERYLLDYARQAQAAQADMFCVGRELDRTVIRRERDWRRLIARVREVFRGSLVYSANFDSYREIGFWDALDFIGISAYFPLSLREQPTVQDLEAGWDAALTPLEEVAGRFGRPVLFTEVGYPSVASAAQKPFREVRAPADPWLQARCYEAALRAVGRRPWIRGVYWWLWEGVAQPPFRDASYTMQGKPASFVMAFWYRGS